MFMKILFVLWIISIIVVSFSPLTYAIGKIYKDKIKKKKLEQKQANDCQWAIDILNELIITKQDFDKIEKKLNNKKITLKEAESMVKGKISDKERDNFIKSLNK